MYRPQFAYKVDAGYDDLDFSHYFDFTTVPFLNNTALAAGAILLNIPLQTQTDFPFYLRGIQVKSGPVVGQNLLPPAIQVRFKDPFNHDMGNDWAPVGLYVAPSGMIDAPGFTLPTVVIRANPLTVVFEPEIRAPAGAVWWLSIRNPNASTVDLTQVRILFQGVKRMVGGGGGCAS